MSEIAGSLTRQAVERDQRGIGKVLVTDLDNCLWSGIVGEDGPDGVSAQPDGNGYIHFIYQNYLKALRDSGILLAVASRNDPDLARAPLAIGGMPLDEGDFISIEASYGKKSEAVKSIAESLNIGLGNIVFVDDNPIELAEVGAAVPEVTLVQFPSEIMSMPTFFSRMNLLFHHEQLTDEDRNRHRMYKARASLAKDASKFTCVDDFLSSLDMKLRIFERGKDSWARAIQLINKTNQFNINGIRRTESEVAEVLAQGGHLYTAMLSDTGGDHGEVISLLIDGEGAVQSFVMSCRVFQRQAEFAFLIALKDELPNSLKLSVRRTERNTPFLMFLKQAGLTNDGSAIECNLESLSHRHSNVMDLFTIDGLNAHP